METMRAAVLPAVNEPLTLEHRPIPQPSEGEVRVRVEACGVCGSDLFLQRGGFGHGKLPVVPGHEAAGVIDALGPGVDGWSMGEQVAIYYIDSPAAGGWATTGRPNLDPALRRMGVDVDGAFAEYVVRPAHTLVRPPSPIDPAALAVLTDAVATPHHALRLGQVQAGDTVVVIGVGGIGSNAIQLARNAGATVVAVSRSEAKEALALRLGAHAVVPVDAADLDRAIAAIRSECGPRGADVVLQCVGSPRMEDLAIGVAGPGGRVVLVGAGEKPFTVRSVDLIWRELRLIGSRGFTPEDIQDVLTLYVEGAVSVAHLTEHTRPLAEVNDAFEDLRAGRVLRSVLLPNG